MSGRKRGRPRKPANQRKDQYAQHLVAHVRIDWPLMGYLEARLPGATRSEIIKRGMMLLRRKYHEAEKGERVPEVMAEWDSAGFRAPGVAFAEARRAVGMSQGDLADKIEKSVTAVAQFEIGVAPMSFATMIAAVKAMGFELEMRVVRVGAPEKPDDVTAIENEEDERDMDELLLQKALES
jgi:transcriptional regulator with XRE-family HTH domain